MTLHCQVGSFRLKWCLKRQGDRLNMLEFKNAAALTKDDYHARKALVDQKLEKLLQKAEEGDSDDLDQYIAELEDDALADQIRTQVGKSKPSLPIKPTETCKTLVQKLQQERRKRKAAQRLRIKEQELRQQKIQEEKLKLLQEQEQKEKAEFEQKKQSIIETIQARRQRIKDFKQDDKKQIHKYVSRSPLHQKIQAEFQDEDKGFMGSELHRRKEMLSQIRNLHQPIRLNEIKQHSEHKKQLFKEKMKEYFKRRATYAHAAKDNKDRYNSKFWKVVNSREQIEKTLAEKEKSQVKEKLKRSLNYAKNIKELYKPTVSKKKKLEMELIKKNLENPHSLSKSRRGLQTTKENHNSSMMSPVSNKLSTESSPPLRKSHKKFLKPKPLDEKRYSYHPKPNEKYPFVKHDYLQERRQKKEDKIYSRQNKSQERWEQDMLKGHYTQGERIEYIKQKASVMEEEMNRKEALLKANNTSTIDDTREINGMLIDSIRTKLELLSGIN
ncbi:unnamed protein product [Moneuplotes crassus]|uniref:Uncharacterized protein n=1 Tax=Euplotes crassus TaxID=5936 RepID=A0AAD1XP46_EUPCR|nr:unnamed protein product [Moneuplotes crassus]